MEELIELLINAIARWMMNARKPAAPPQNVVRKVPSNRATVTANMPAARRKVLRRPAPPVVALAKPIITGRRAAAASPAAVVPARAIAAKAVASSHAGTAQSAAAIRKWLNPATLKRQFILTEILQPPLSLRHTIDDRKI